MAFFSGTNADAASSWNHIKQRFNQILGSQPFLKMHEIGGVVVSFRGGVDHEEEAVARRFVGGRIGDTHETG